MVTYAIRSTPPVPCIDTPYGVIMTTVSSLAAAWWRLPQPYYKRAFKSGEIKEIFVRETNTEHINTKLHTIVRRRYNADSIIMQSITARKMLAARVNRHYIYE